MTSQKTHVLGRTVGGIVAVCGAREPRFGMSGRTPIFKSEAQATCLRCLAILRPTTPTAGPRKAGIRRTPSSAQAGEGPAQDAWSALCESHGTRCVVVKDGARCEGGVAGDRGPVAADRCPTHQSDESILAVRQAVADEIVADLAGPSAAVVEGYKSDDPCRQDKVYVEEGVSAALEPLGLATTEHVPTCRIVFDWLKAEHGIDPPAWILEAGR